MRLVFFGDGKSVHIVRWLSFFKSRGHEVHLLSEQPAKEDGIVWHNLTGILNVSGFKGLRLLKRIRRIKRLVAEIKPDLIHAHYLFPYGLWAGVSGLRPLVLSVWGSDVYIDAKNPVRRMLVRPVLSRADLVTADSEDLCRAAVNIGAPPEKTEYFPWGVDTKMFMPGRKNIARKQLGIDRGPVIISTRNLEKLYNIDEVISAMPEIIRHFPEAKLMILGAGSMEEKLKNMVKEKGLSGAVVFAGQKQFHQMPDYFSAADLFISIPSSDATSMSLLEAMSSGLAIIASDLPSNREWIKNGWNGRIVPADPKKLSSAVIETFSSPENMALYGKRSREKAIQKADFYSLMPCIERTYEELVRKHHA